MPTIVTAVAAAAALVIPPTGTVVGDVLPVTHLDVTHIDVVLGVSLGSSWTRLVTVAIRCLTILGEDLVEIAELGAGSADVAHQRGALSLQLLALLGAHDGPLFLEIVAERGDRFGVLFGRAPRLKSAETRRGRVGIAVPEERG